MVMIVNDKVNANNNGAELVIIMYNTVNLLLHYSPVSKFLSSDSAAAVSALISGINFSSRLWIFRDIRGRPYCCRLA